MIFIIHKKSPAEVFLLKFNLELEIINTYYTLINLGFLLIGMAYEAKLHSYNLHKPISPPNAIGEIISAKIFNEIHEFEFD